jgi:hypothetical protein
LPAKGVWVRVDFEGFLSKNRRTLRFYLHRRNTVRDFEPDREGIQRTSKSCA